MRRVQYPTHFDLCRILLLTVSPAFSAYSATFGFTKCSDLIGVPIVIGVAPSAELHIKSFFKKKADRQYEPSVYTHSDVIAALFKNKFAEELRTVKIRLFARCCIPHSVMRYFAIVSAFIGVTVKLVP